MGENILRREPADGPPQETERSTAEITAQRLYELMRDPAHDEFEPELEFVAGLPEYRPEATPVPWPGGSAPRLAHTLRRIPTPDAVPALVLADVETRPVAHPGAIMHELPIDAPRSELAPIADPPKRPLAPRTGRERLVVPLALVLVTLGAAAFLLLR